jgi:predicted molibdopterin-dependent oxidoreductase YjgC
MNYTFELIQSCKGCIIEINGKNLDAGLSVGITIRVTRVLEEFSYEYSSTRE